MYMLRQKDGPETCSGDCYMSSIEVAYDLKDVTKYLIASPTEGEEFTSDQMKTNPQQALRFAQETGIDALAVSYGSSHGNYPEGYVPEFDFERLKEIKELTKMPLVLHGGSGSGDENILKSVKYGINKINVGCDFMNANTEAIKKHLAADPDINFWVMMHQVEKESQELVKHYIRLSGSEGKSL